MEAFRILCLGVWITLDRGKQVHSLSERLPSVPVHDLIVYPRDDELAIGIHGRSGFILDVESIWKQKKELMD